VRDWRGWNNAHAQWICNGCGVTLYQYLQIRWKKLKNRTRAKNIDERPKREAKLKKANK